jgi:hypothetical protein
LSENSDFRYIAQNLDGLIVDIAEFWVFTKSTIRGIILGETEALNRYRETGKFFSYKTSEPEQ